MHRSGEVFPRSSRLLTSEAYSRVFKSARKSVDRNFTVLWRTTRHAQCRLGMAISKKNTRRAVDRNLLKRLVRESFRKRLNGVSGMDVVVLSRRGLPLGNREALRDSLDKHWRRLIEQHDKK